MLQKLSVKEFAKLRNVSEKTVYNWIENNRIEFIEEMVQNRPVKFILVATVPEPSENYSETNEQNKSLHEIQPQLTEFIQLIERLNNQNIELAGLAGQTKLLTDSEHKTKEEYFKTIQENATLKAKLDTSQKKIEELQEKLNQQEQSKLSNWLKRL